MKKYKKLHILLIMLGFLAMITGYSLNQIETAMCFGILDGILVGLLV